MDSPETFLPNGNNPSNEAAARHRLLVVVALFVTWLAGLGFLSVVTANPVTLNRDQIAESIVILAAEIQDAKTGLVTVRKTWKNPAWKAEKLTLPNLLETGASNGQILIIPITSKGDDSYRVTPSKLPHQPPLVYPMTPESERQLLSLLKTGRLP